MNIAKYTLPNEKEKLQILQARREGITYAVIAQRFNISMTYIKNLCKRNRIQGKDCEYENCKSEVTQKRNRR